MNGPPEWLRQLSVRARAVELVDAPWCPPRGQMPRASAVLVLFGAGEQAGSDYVLVVERAATLRFHPSQIAFPGGAADPTDVDVIDTALREAEEEIGLDPSGVRILATLPPRWISVSDFLVTPVLGWWAFPHEVSPVDRAEVARVDRLTINELADPANRVVMKFGAKSFIPAFRTRGMLVWGFTAGVLATILELGGWVRSWSDCPVEDHRTVDDSTVR